MSEAERLAAIEAKASVVQQEPFGYFCDWGDYSGCQRIAMYYGEPGSAIEDDWNEYPKVHNNMPLYTHPVQQAKPLSDEQIQAAVTAAVKGRRLSWLGFEKDEIGSYTVPVLSPSDFQFARAIEAAHGIQGS